MVNSKLINSIKSIKATVSLPLKYLIDFVLPCTCIVCGKEVNQGLVCNDCFDLVINTRSPSCPHCGRPIDKTKTCGFCRNEKYLDYGRAFALYVPPVDTMIHHLKYRGKTNLAKFFGLGMAGVLKADYLLKEVDFLTPVPLFWWKKLRRNYNQAELLSTIIHQETSVPIVETLIRVKNTKTQTRLDHKTRQENVRNAFKAKNGIEIKNKKIILIDDVMTTGATIKECARVIKEAGAEKVYSLVSAITP
ncbi:MAG: ComF family protein [candidate division WOR-3 bacterium]